MAINWQQLIQKGGTTQAPTTAPTAPVVTPPMTGNPVGTGVSSPAFGVMPYISPERMPEVARQFLDLTQNYTYSFPAQGYISKADASNANSYYNKFGGGGGGDPRANQAMGNFYSMLGALPTTAVTSGALSKLNQERGTTPSLGPSLNETLGKLLSSPMVKLLGQHPSSTWQGPYSFGERDDRYNPFGVFKG